MGRGSEVEDILLVGDTIISKARKRGRPSPEEAEAISRQILSAATVIFMSRSFEDISIEEIALLAGVKKNTIYKRFEDKRAILRAVLICQLAKWSDRDSYDPATGDIAQRLKARAVHVLETSISNDIRLWSRLAENAWPGLDELDNRRKILGYDRVVRQFADDMRHSGEDGSIVPRNPDLAATALMSILTGWTDTLGQASAIQPQEIRRFATFAVDLVVHGRAAW